MGKYSRVAGVLAVGNALLFVVGLALPFRVTAEAPAQGQALAVLLLLGLGPRPGAQPAIPGQKPASASDAQHGIPGRKPAPPSVGSGTDRRAPDTVAKKPQYPEGRLVRVTYDEVNGRKVVRTVEFGEPPALPLATPVSADARLAIKAPRHSAPDSIGPPARAGSGP